MMQDNAKKPAIRFAGFNDAWEQRKFGNDILSIQTGTSKLGSTTNEGRPLLKMGNIQRGYFSLEKMEFLAREDDVESENIAYYGDFFFNTRNTLELVGKGATWTGTSGKYAFNSNIARFKLRELDTIFFNYLYNTTGMIEQVHARAMGTTSVAAIYPQSLKSICYYVPSCEEQEKIGAFLLALDHLIALHQRKYTKLVNIKKSMLEKMFPQNGSKVPEIRFAGFTDAWEQRKLGDVAERVIVGLATSVTPYYRENGTPIFRNLNIKENFLDDSDILFLDEEYAKSQGSKKIHTGDVLSVHTGYIGISCLVPEKYDDCLTFTTLITTPDKELLDGGYLVHYLNSPKGMAAIQAVTTQGGRQNLNTNDFIKVPVSLPSVAEQRRISAFIDKIDHLIALHQRKLERLQNIKKACLEKMFV